MVHVSCTCLKHGRCLINKQEFSRYFEGILWKGFKEKRTVKAPPSLTLGPWDWGE